MKTIVTGGAGFIGSHLVSRLVKEGREVAVVDDLYAGNLDNLFNLGLKQSDFQFVKADLANYQNALKALEGGETVFHLAARIGGIKYLHGNENSELSALRENILIDSNVFKACQERKIKKIIYASSSAVYSTEKQYSSGAILSEDDFVLNLKEKDPRFLFDLRINPDGGYGFAKLLGEIQLNLMGDIKVGMARIFNVYGINEPLDERSHAISDLIRKTINYPKEDFIVWGNGEQSRDYVYVSDCVDSLIGLERKITEVFPSTINIGFGRAVSIREIAEKVIEISGKDIKIKYDLEKPVGPISRTASTEKAKGFFDHQPKVSIDEGLKKTYFWVKEQLI